MASNFNAEFLSLIDEITATTGKTDQEISVSAKRNPGYVTQLKSRIKAGKEVPGGFIELLRLRFANDLNARNMEKKVNRLQDESLNLQASVNILLKTVENISATQKGTEVSLVSGQMRQAIKIEYDRLHEELAKAE